MLVGPPNTLISVFPRMDTSEPIPVRLDRETLFDAIPIGHSLIYVFETKNM
jgi:hypothetical protein